MYGGGMPDTVIIEKSGHKSIKPLRTYEGTTGPCTVTADASNPKKIKVEDGSAPGNTGCSLAGPDSTPFCHLGRRDLF